MIHTSVSIPYVLVRTHTHTVYNYNKYTTYQCNTDGVYDQSVLRFSLFFVNLFRRAAAVRRRRGPPAAIARVPATRRLRGPSTPTWTTFRPPVVSFCTFFMIVVIGRPGDLLRGSEFTDKLYEKINIKNTDENYCFPRGTKNNPVSSTKRKSL